MKKFLTPVFVAFAAFAFAQAPLTTMPNWQGARFGLAAGGDIEMPHGLGHRYLLSTAIHPDFDNSQLPFSKGDLVRMECDNGTFRIGFSLSPFRSPDSEIQFSLLSIDGRIDKVRYEAGTEGQADWQWLDVSATNQETAVEFVYLRNSRSTKALNFFAGLGTNIGYSHSGEVKVQGFLLDESITDVPAQGKAIDLTYPQKESINQRIFFQAGMAVRFLKRMELGFECRKGLGYRASIDGPFHLTTLKRSLGFSLRYSLS